MDKKEIDKQILKWEQNLRRHEVICDNYRKNGQHEGAEITEHEIYEIKRFLVSLYNIKRIDFED